MKKLYGVVLFGALSWMGPVVFAARLSEREKPYGPLSIGQGLSEVSKFNAPVLSWPSFGLREWFRGPMRDYLYDHLTGNDSRTQAYYRRPALDKVLSEHVSGRQNHEKLLWCLLNLEIWHREYGIAG